VPFLKPSQIVLLVSGTPWEYFGTPRSIQKGGPEPRQIKINEVWFGWHSNGKAYQVWNTKLRAKAGQLWPHPDARIKHWDQTFAPTQKMAAPQPPRSFDNGARARYLATLFGNDWAISFWLQAGKQLGFIASTVVLFTCEIWLFKYPIIFPFTFFSCDIDNNDFGEANSKAQLKFDPNNEWDLKIKGPVSSREHNKLHVRLKTSSALILLSPGESASHSAPEAIPRLPRGIPSPAKQKFSYFVIRNPVTLN
jgi:hypothetical protein